MTRDWSDVVWHVYRAPGRKDRASHRELSSGELRPGEALHATAARVSRAAALAACSASELAGGKYTPAQVLSTWAENQHGRRQTAARPNAYLQLCEAVRKRRMGVGS